MIIVSVLTLLILSLLQSVMLEVKVNRAFKESNLSMQQLELSAYQIVKSNILKQNHHCFTKDKNYNHQVTLLRQRFGCTSIYEKTSYRFLIADLGIFSCLQVLTNDGSMHGTHHWLLSIVEEENQQAVLQIRIALPGEDNVCSTDNHVIHLGILSLRKVFYSL